MTSDTAAVAAVRAIRERFAGYDAIHFYRVPTDHVVIDTAASIFRFVVVHEPDRRLCTIYRTLLSGLASDPLMLLPAASRTRSHPLLPLVAAAIAGTDGTEADRTAISQWLAHGRKYIDSGSIICWHEPRVEDVINGPESAEIHPLLKSVLLISAEQYGSAVNCAGGSHRPVLVLVSHRTEPIPPEFELAVRVTADSGVYAHKKWISPLSSSSSSSSSSPPSLSSSSSPLRAPNPKWAKPLPTPPPPAYTYSFPGPHNKVDDPEGDAIKRAVYSTKITAWLKKKPSGSHQASGNPHAKSPSPGLVTDVR